MSGALFDVLIGEYADGNPVRRNDPQGELLSVRDHLRRLLNARRGALVHLPEYGLPDVPAMYQGLPYSAEDLVRAVQYTIQRFEPRLRHVQVRCLVAEPYECVVSMEVSGVLAGLGRARFQTRFESGGQALVQGVVPGEKDHARVL